MNSAEAKCIQCKKPLDGRSQTRCKKCLAWMREYVRQYKGYKPWKPGGAGRPPYEHPLLKEKP